MSKVNRVREKMVVGLTGGIASGKTTVLREFARYGIPTVSSDELAHQCLRKGHPAHRAIVRRFGRSILSRAGKIDRKALGSLVFQNPRKRKELEAIVHPHVKRALRRYIKTHSGLIVLDVPLLFEARMENWFDWVIVVASSNASQVKRLTRRNGLSVGEARLRIRSQWPMRQKRARADHVLMNDGTLAHLKKETRQLIQYLKISSRPHVR